MPSTRRLTLAASLLVLAFVPALAANAEDREAWAHVRTESIDARGLVDDAAARSPSIRALVDRLEHSDVVVYVRFAQFGRTQLNGRVGFLSTGGRWRYLIVELACPRVRSEQIATLGHELHHAVEIADAPAVIGPRSLAQH